MPQTWTAATPYLNVKQIVWRIAVYIRLSKEDGNIESESVVNQKKILSEYLEQYFDGQFVIADFYVDDGLTGTDDSRENFMRMIHDIEQGKVNCVVCKTLSRAFRNYSDQGYYLEYYFPLKSVRFISTGDPKIDTFKNPEVLTGLEVPITGLMNDRFAAQTSNAIRRTFNTKRRNGEFIGAFAPYGYKKDPDNKNRLIVDEDAAKIVRDVFNWFVYDGVSKRGIARKLNEMGEPSPTKYKRQNGYNYNSPTTKMHDGLWSMTPVHQILTNKMYTGCMVQGRQKVISYKVHSRVSIPESDWFIVPNTHEAIIKQDLFDKEQELNKREVRTPNTNTELHLFSGFMRCADCKNAMHRKTAHDLTYYFCRSYTDKKVCSKHTIRVDKLEKAVLAAIQIQIALVDDLTSEINRINEAPTPRRESKHLLQSLSVTERQLSQYSEATDSLYMDWKNGDITRDEYLRLKEKLTAQAKQAEQKIKRLQEEIELSKKAISETDPYFEHFTQYRNIDSLNRGILVELIDTIWVHENGGITIDFNFQDQYLQILDYIETNSNN
jgi:hypothetical protein